MTPFKEDRQTDRQTDDMR